MMPDTINPVLSSASMLRPVPLPNIVEINGKKYQITTLKLRDPGAENWRSVDLTNYTRMRELAQSCAHLFKEIHNPQDGMPQTLTLTFEMESKGWIKKEPYAVMHLKKIETSQGDSSTVKTREFEIKAYSPDHQRELQDKLDPIHEILQETFLRFPQTAPQLYSRPATPPSTSERSTDTIDGREFEYGDPPPIPEYWTNIFSSSTTSKNSTYSVESDFDDFPPITFTEINNPHDNDIDNIPPV